MSRRSQTVDAHLYEAPDPGLVATIIATKGIDAAQERWHWCERRTLMSIARSGRARTGIAPKFVCLRTSALNGKEAVAIEATYVLKAMAAVDVALGVGKNATRSLFYKRGLDLPKSHGERVAEGMLGRRIRAGDTTAVTEREAKQAHARAVCDVLSSALSLVPDQPSVGRLRLPPVDDVLREALAGLPQSAIEAVFPTLADEGGPVTSEPDSMRESRVSAAFHGVESTSDVAAEHGLSCQAVYRIWRGAGLSVADRERRLKKLSRIQRYLAPPEDDAPCATLQDEDVHPVSLPSAVEPAPDPEVIAVTEIPSQPYRRAPNDSIIRCDHADGQPLVVLAAHHGITPSTLYSHWRRLGLSGRGRLEGFVTGCKTVAPVIKVVTQVPPPSEVIPVVAEPVAPNLRDAVPVAEEAEAYDSPVEIEAQPDVIAVPPVIEPPAVVSRVPALIEAPVHRRLGLDDLVLVIRLSRLVDMPQVEALALVRADAAASLNERT